GNALPLVRDFRQTFIDTVSSPLDWSYRPYAELSAHDVTNTNRDYLLRTQTTYRLRDNISVDANYQLTYSMGNYLDQRKVASYYTRNLINQFYQPGATNRFAIPKGDIFRTRSSENVSHQGRLQLNYSQLFNNGNEIQILVGWEVKKTDWNSNSNTIYGYTERGSLVNSSLNFDQEYPLYYNPSIKRRISTGHSITNTADRFLSYYINASYSLSDKYFVSASARKDAANLFGVKANQRGVPLWSIGFAWQATREPFLDNRWLSNLKFRVTYGANGNFSRKAAALSTLSYTISNNNNPAATISTPPNSRLRWERTNVFNLGVDFGLWQGRLKGVLEYYSKNIKDILAEAPVDPTFGISSFYGNVASMEGEGFEIELSSFIPLSTSWRWDGSLLFSYAQTRVTDYLLPTPGTADFLNAGSIITPIVEKPLYSIYSYRWAGLDSETGDPQGYLNDEISKD